LARFDELGEAEKSHGLFPRQAWNRKFSEAVFAGTPGNLNCKKKQFNVSHCGRVDQGQINQSPTLRVEVKSGNHTFD